MSVEDELRALRTPDPAGLVPPPDLADAVLRGLRRRRRRTGVAVAAVLAAAVAVPVAVPGGGGRDGGRAGSAGSAAAPTPPRTPTRLDLPGGPVTVTAFTVAATGRTALLDPATGRYVELPAYEAVRVSPDQATVAVYDGSRVGVVARDALLRGDTDTLRWTGLVGVPVWSPDGKALLATEVAKDAGPTYLLRRYDLATGQVSTTEVLAPGIAGYPEWAPNSRDYLLPKAVAEGGASRPLGMQVLRPDGSEGLRWEGPVGGVAYSPDRRRATVDPSEVISARPTGTGVVDTRTGDQVASLPAGPRTVGWYGPHTVVQLLDTPQLQVVDVRDGSVVEVVPLPRVPALSDVELGRATGKAPGF